MRRSCFSRGHMAGWDVGCLWKQCQQASERAQQPGRTTRHFPRQERKTQLIPASGLRTDATEHPSFTAGVTRELAAYQLDSISEDGKWSALTGQHPLPGSRAHTAHHAPTGSLAEEEEEGIF